MVCDDPADPLPLSVAQYVVRLAGQGALETFGVTPLPEPIRIQTFAPLKVTPGGASPAASSSRQPHCPACTCGRYAEGPPPQRGGGPSAL